MNRYLKASLLDAVVCGLNLAAYRRTGIGFYLCVATVFCMYAVKYMRLHIKWHKARESMCELFRQIKKDTSEGD